MCWGVWPTSRPGGLGALCRDTGAPIPWGICRNDRPGAPGQWRHLAGPTIDPLPLGLYPPPCRAVGQLQAQQGPPWGLWGLTLCPVESSRGRRTLSSIPGKAGSGSIGGCTCGSVRFSGPHIPLGVHTRCGPDLRDLFCFGGSPYSAGPPFFRFTARPEVWGFVDVLRWRKSRGAGNFWLGILWRVQLWWYENTVPRRRCERSRSRYLAVFPTGVFP